MALDGADELFTLKNAFWLGNFQAAINEGSTLMLTDAGVKADRDGFVYRSYIALGEYAVVLDEVADDSPHAALRAVKLLAKYKSDPDGSRAATIATLRSWEDDFDVSHDPTASVVAATIFTCEHDYDSALKFLRDAKTLPPLAMTVAVLLKLDRIDLAAKARARMASIDDDATITALASAWVNLALGGEGVSEAVQTYQELIERFGSSLPLLNGLGAALMQQGKFAEAEKKFIDAIGMGANNPDTLVNLIACAQQQGKPKEHVDRYIAQLRRAAPKHPYVASLDAVERMFDRVSGAGASHK